MTASPIHSASTPAASRRSIGILVLAWLILQLGGIFSPGLLDDVDSIYIEIARQMLLRRDFVTPWIDGIRFFDKPPLMYWMASASMRIFGIHDWSARLPLAISVLLLIFAVYALGRRLFQSERAGFYSALAIATAIGPYLYTRFYIPDILIALWMTVAVHLFLIALDRIHTHASALLPCLGFAAVMALNVLTKGLIGILFPIGFVMVYLAITRQLRLLTKLHFVSSAIVFAVIAAPWHILAALRNPAIPMPPGLGLPPRAGWVWFYLYNEHIARFLGKRIPHDYGQTPVWLFWLYTAIWIMPWTAFLPGAIAAHIRTLRTRIHTNAREYEAALTLLLWPLLVLSFFTFSSRQEYYCLPALPALALMAGGLLARADINPAYATKNLARISALKWSAWLLVPLTTLVACICGYFAIAAPHPAPNADLSTLLTNNPDLYNLSLGHLFDLTGAAMGLFRGPLAAVAIGMLAIGLGSYLFRRSGRSYAANLTLAAGMIVTLLAAHEGLVRFNPILGSKDLALSITGIQQPGDLIVLDGELTSGSTLIFYTGQQVHLINGRINTLWFGSFWPDAPHIFEDEASLHRLWPSNRRIFLFTYNPTTRTKDLAPFGPVHALSSAGGKTILTNR